MSILTIDEVGIPTLRLNSSNLDFFHKLIKKQKEPEEEPEQENDIVKVYAAAQASEGEIIEVEWSEIV